MSEQDDHYDRDITVKIGDKEYEGFEVRSGYKQTTVLPMSDEALPTVHHIHGVDMRIAEIGTLMGDNPMYRILMRLVLAENQECQNEQHFMVQVDPDNAMEIFLMAFRCLMPRDISQERMEEAGELIKELTEEYWDWNGMAQYVSEREEDGDGDS